MNEAIVRNLIWLEISFLIAAARPSCTALGH